MLIDPLNYIYDILFWDTNMDFLGSIYLLIFLVICGYLLFVNSLW